MKTPLTLFLTYLTSSFLWGQHIYSLQDLQDSARKNNVSLQQLQLDVEKAEKQNLNYNGIGATSVNYTYGQIDGLDQDYQWQIMQPVGNPFAGIANQNLREASVRNNQLNFELNRAWVEMKIYTTYAQYQAWQRIRNIRMSVSEAFEKAEKVALRQYQEGEISKIESALIRGRYLESVQQENQALQESLSRVYLLEVLTRTELKNDSLAPLQDLVLSPKIQGDANNLYLGYYESTLELAEETKKRQNAEFFPSFSLGYFNQRLGGVTGLEGFSVAARLPLLDVNTYQQKQLAAIDLAQTRLQLEQQNWERQSRLILLERQKNQVVEKLRGFDLKPEETAENLRITRRRFELGEIDMLQLSQSLEALSAAEINQQLLLMNLHQILAELDYLNTELP